MRVYRHVSFPSRNSHEGRGREVCQTPGIIRSSIKQPSGLLRTSHRLPGKRSISKDNIGHRASGIEVDLGSMQT